MRVRLRERKNGRQGEIERYIDETTERDSYRWRDRQKETERERERQTDKRT